MDKSTFTPHYEAFRTKLVALRKAAGLTQRQLAAKLKRERSFIARVEQGERRLDVLEFYRYCRACGAKPDQVSREVMATFARMDRKRR